jgi:quinoprotein glucose dehydrogenase
MGLGLTVASMLLIMRRQAGLSVYALTLAITFIWTLYEVDFDKWQWIPRGALPIFLGILLSLPFVTNGLSNRPQRPWAIRLTNGVFALRAVVAIISPPINAAPLIGGKACQNSLPCKVWSRQDS